MLSLLEWLWSLLRLRRAETPAVLDPCLGDPQAAQLRELLAAGDFPAAEAMLLACSDIEALDHLIDAGSAWPGRPAWVDAWVAQAPGSAFARLLRGAQGLRWAWEVRGSGLAASVSAAAWQPFYERLEAANEDFEEAQRRAPDSPLPSAWSIRGLSAMRYEKEQIEATFDHAVERAPTLLRAHLAMLTALCAKWGGSEEAMFAFARAHAHKSAALQTLVAAAHIERFIAIDDIDERSAYGRRGEVRSELQGAFEAFQRGVGGVPAIIGGNYFAFALCMTRDAPRAAKAFAWTRSQITRVPWLYLDDPQAAYERFRRQAR